MKFEAWIPISDPLANLWYVVDLLGTLVFSTTGAAAAIQKKLDLVGIVVLAFVAGTAGGIIRDLLIGAVPPAAISSLKYFGLSLVAALLAFGWYPRLGDLRRIAVLIDAAGLGLFAVAGTEKALLYGIQPVLAAALGVLTAIGGGIVRDTLIREIPAVFQQSELYATAALAGAVVVVAGHAVQVNPVVGATLGSGLAFVIRLVAIRRGWKLPTAGFRS